MILSAHLCTYAPCTRAPVNRTAPVAPSAPDAPDAPVLKDEPYADLQFAASAVDALACHFPEVRACDVQLGNVPGDVVEHVIGLDPRFEAILVRQLERLCEG